MTGCEKNVEEKVFFSGKYSGTFERTTGAGSKVSSNVSITFNDANYSGTSDRMKFPAICNGTYSTKNNEIHFTNSCMWTADFDWSLILNNDYTYKSSGDSLEIKREYAGQMTDLYKLKKEQN
ncbi:hypothetical protein SAE01_46750 [Segetibacter aerophilus]|uniref:Lipocalin-like domain-containing protein n=2 Tax=Segetibacter aerophilus TaxID=670293 RepID=A0A512BJN7_9BACT|nr:hypothetical protein SAE01_46750 [Segetibacter aerophilus]